MGTEDQTIKIFVSSPGDVEEERLIAQRVLKRLADQFSRVVQIEPIFWEHEPLVATQSFQEGIPSPADTDIVLCILWARIGTRLPPSIHRPDGSAYASGTEYEFETAVEGHRQHGHPDLLIYRKTAQPDPKAKGPEDLITFGEQWRALDGFVKKWFHGEDGTLVAAFHPFQEPASFEQILEVHLRKLIEKRLAAWGLPPDVTRLPPPASWTSGSPFRGLEVFEFEHAPIFFGRTKAVSEVLAALRRQAQTRRSFLLILGGSGCGKSSLVRAGVLPMLTQPSVIEGVGLWRRAVMRPAAVSRSASSSTPASTPEKSSDLFDALAAALVEPTALPELMADGTSVENVAKMLRTNPAGAYALVKGALSQAAALVKPAKEAKSQPEARLVLVVDQLEEIFSDKRFTAAGRNALFVALADLALSGKVWVIATLRSDFYHRCQEIPDLVALKGADGQLDLSPPTPAEIGQMIRQPASAAGLHFDVDQQTGQTLDDALQNEAAGIKEGLPLLEFALDELYRHAAAACATNTGSIPASQLLLTFDDYRALKGLAGCLAERAEETFQGLDAVARGSFAKVFRKLVVLDSTERLPTRRIAPMSEFEHDPAFVRFVDRFVRARLFTADRAVGPDGGATVRIAHEALLTTAEWKTLRDWLAADRENLQMRGRVAAAAHQWNDNRRDTSFLYQGARLASTQEWAAAHAEEINRLESEFISASRRRARLQRLQIVAVVAVVLVGVTLGWLAIRAQNEEKRQADYAAALLEQLDRADIMEVRGIVQKVGAYRFWADPLLKQKDAPAAQSSNKKLSSQKLHLALALLPVDESKVAELRDELPLVSQSEFPVVRDALLPGWPGSVEGRPQADDPATRPLPRAGGAPRAGVLEPLWNVALDPKRQAQQRFQTACALATYAPDDQRWSQIKTFVAGRLVTLEASALVAWREALRPAKEQLIEPLASIYRDAAQKEQTRSFATETLADYAAEQPAILFNLLADAELFQFSVLFEKLAVHKDKAVALANEQIDKQLPATASEDQKELLAKRQANAAVALFRLGTPERAWKILKHSPDPRVRSYVIHWLSPRGAEPQPILQRLDAEPDVTIRRALVLTLGQFTDTQLSAAQRQPLIEKLLVAYENEPDAGLHGAAEWLLQKWGQGKRLEAVAQKLKSDENHLQAVKAIDRRRWFVNTQKQTFVIVDGGEFLMGSADSEPGHLPRELQHRCRIGRRFAIAATEVTKEQFGRFQTARPEIEKRNTDQWVKTDDSPQVEITWYEAAAYCNYLSEQEGIAKGEWCYEQNKEGKYEAGMKAKENHLKLTGYRLPTEAEWEYACRAGTVTSRYYGMTEELLPQYERYLKNGENKAWPVRSLKPNDLGLFDMLGNALEWCFDRYVAAYPKQADKVFEDVPTTQPVEAGDRHVSRGGAFNVLPVVVRCADRNDNLPADRYHTFGFRPARTYP